jgi:hypothetical protein
MEFARVWIIPVPSSHPVLQEMGATTLGNETVKEEIVAATNRITI